MDVLVSASLLAANKDCLIDELDRVNKSKVDFVHFDVMDGAFVNNISFNDDSFDKIRKYSSLRFEIHLMVDNPFDYIDKYSYSKDDVIIIHYESFKNEDDLLRCILKIKENHLVGLSFKPNTKVEKIERFLKYLDYVLVMSVEPGFGGQKFLESSLDKISLLKKKRNGYRYLIEVDGGINNETGPRCVNAGVDILVSGSYIFKGDMSEKVRSLR